MIAEQKNICIAFLGNALYDSRIVNLTNSLKEEGCHVSVISFDWFISPKDHSDKGVKVFKLTKGKFSLIFYLRFTLILMRELFHSKADIYFAEDLYTLPFVTTIAKLKRTKVYYNSRELYAFLGGLRKRQLLQFVVKQIEKFFIKKVDLVLTTGEMDSDYLEKFYDIRNTMVIRNIPLYQTAAAKIDYRKIFGIAEDKIILLYQGVLLEGRGIPLMMRAVAKLPQTVLILLGDGEQKNNFRKMADKLKISERVIFAGAIDQKDLITYTTGADIGLSLIENISISYFHALPNKLFEYIMAGLPVIVSDLPQMKSIVEKYQVGEAVNIENNGEENILTTLKRWIEEPERLEIYRTNCANAAKELNWQAEYKRARSKLLGIA